jgi:glycosyltransferase involved in cell wall biosynthesis
MFIFAQIKKRLAKKKLKQYLIEKQITDLLITAAHPWDLYLGDFARKNGIKVTRIIHDFQPHPGEIWPTRFFISRSIKKSDLCLCLSSFVYEQVSQSNLHSHYVKFPQESIPEPIQDFALGSDYILFIGRIKKYKGLKLLIKAWNDLEKTDQKLVIAGKAYRSYQSNHSNIVHLNRWLRDEEIHALISGATFVVLPYIEASQSGIIPIAEYFQTPVIISNVGGLREQLNPNMKFIEVQAKSRLSLTTGLKLGMEGRFCSDLNDKKTENLIDFIKRVLL